MKRALLLLPQPGQTVTCVSNALGYSSPEHFSGAFRKYFGISPKNFLKAQKEFLLPRHEEKNKKFTGYSFSEAAREALFLKLEIEFDFSEIKQKQSF